MWIGYYKNAYIPYINGRFVLIYKLLYRLNFDQWSWFNSFYFNFINIALILISKLANVYWKWLHQKQTILCMFEMNILIFHTRYHFDTLFFVLAQDILILFSRTIGIPPPKVQYPSYIILLCLWWEISRGELRAQALPCQFI